MFWEFDDKLNVGYGLCHVQGEAENHLKRRIANLFDTARGGE